MFSRVLHAPFATPHVFLMHERRDFPQSTSSLRGVTATSSLELGVDIASLDAVVIVGFPGSISSLWQRAGRCGRSADSDALCFLVAYPSAIDQWVFSHPKLLSEMAPEDVVVDSENSVVLAQHLLCAAVEEPLSVRRGDRELFGGAALFEPAVASLVNDGKLCEMDSGDWRAYTLVKPSELLGNIRAIEEDAVQVLLRRRRRREQPRLAESFGGGSRREEQRGGVGANGEVGEGGRADAEGAHAEGGADADEEWLEVIDEAELWRVYYELYEGAIYFNQGRKFLVDRLVIDGQSASCYVVPTDARYYTRSLDKTIVTLLQRINTERPRVENGAGGDETAVGVSETAAAPTERAAAPTERAAAPTERAAAPTETAGLLAHYGRVRVTLSVSGFVKIWQKTGEIFEEAPLELPPKTFETRACWVDVSKRAISAFTHEDEPASEELAGEEAEQLSAPTSLEARRAIEGGLSLDAGLHAAAHAVLAVLPIHLSCEPGDFGCECDALKEGRLWPKRLLFFDKRVGGLGIARRAQPRMGLLLRSALAMMQACSCDDGCWRCVHISSCTEYNAATSKRAALLVIEALLSAKAAQPAEDEKAQSPPLGTSSLSVPISLSVPMRSDGSSQGVSSQGVATMGASISRLAAMLPPERRAHLTAAVSRPVCMDCDLRAQPSIVDDGVSESEAFSDYSDVG